MQAATPSQKKWLWELSARLYAPLEKWPKEEVLMGLANGAPIKLKGAAILRVTLPDVNGKKSEEISVRAKVIANGGSTWHGLILGGRV